MDTKRVLLSEKEIPTAWYNLQADLPKPVPPPLHPGTKQPLSPSDLEPIFAKELIAQEVSRERWIEIPEPIRRILTIWRPSPLVRATELEKALKTPARIYFKDESHSPPGSHKPNTSVAQAYYNKIEGVKRLTTETGAGQWGSALAFACALIGLECKVFMVKVSYQQKPYRRSMMQLWGGNVVASPSQETNAGRQILAADPDCPGSLGIAISEAVEAAVSCPDTKYTLGSVLNHVLLHQTIIGLEAEKQFQMIGDFPQVVIGCVGGGSNFSGLAFPFIRHRLKGKEIRFIACEPHSCPSMSRGQYRYDFGDTTKLTPLIKMYTLGHSFVPPGIHAGGLRYHGMAPDGQSVRFTGPYRGGRVSSKRVLRSGATVRQNRGHHSRARNLRMPSAARSTRPSAAAKQARPSASSLISADTACATCRPTTNTLAANWKTTPTLKSTSNPPWPNCRWWSKSVFDRDLTSF